MKIVRDTDIVEFVDEAGDKLILLNTPRKRDLDTCEEIERKEAMEQFQLIKELGVDTDAALAEAEETDPEVLAAAKEKAEDFMAASTKVRTCRLKALALKLIVHDENGVPQQISASAVMETYQNMDAESARWIDERVAEVWKSATPTDAEKHRSGADACVPAVVSASE